MIAIINGCGANIASVQFALERLGKQSLLTTDADVIKSATHVVLPGVGTAQNAMSQLKKMQLIEVIRNLQQPVLGICLGMQILYEFSDESAVDCLKIIPGKIIAFPENMGLTIPHMGWNRLRFNLNTPFLEGVAQESYVYFVHSYIAPLSDNTLACAQYGIAFTAAVRYKNFYGVQFHPERSGEIGATILKNFIKMSD